MRILLRVLFAWGIIYGSYAITITKPEGLVLLTIAVAFIIVGSFGWED